MRPSSSVWLSNTREAGRTPWCGEVVVAEAESSSFTRMPLAGLPNRVSRTWQVMRSLVGGVGLAAIMKDCLSGGLDFESVRLQMGAARTAMVGLHPMAVGWYSAKSYAGSEGGRGAAGFINDNEPLVDGNGNSAPGRDEQRRDNLSQQRWICKDFILAQLLPLPLRTQDSRQTQRGNWVGRLRSPSWEMLAPQTTNGFSACRFPLRWGNHPYRHVTADGSQQLGARTNSLLQFVSQI